LKLTNIAESKVEADEERIAGQTLKGMMSAQLPPCVQERGSFMSPFAIERLHEHPYGKTSPDTHAHFRPSPLRYPAYGTAGVPYRWMMKPSVFGDEKKGERGLIESFPLDDVDEALEKNLGLSFESHWIQDHRNHRALLECFWGHVRPEESLVFFYAKQVPLVEEAGRRVLIGVGRVLSVGPLTEYLYEGAIAGKIRSLLWERMVVHSIRPGFADGFLLPYHEALEKSEDGQSFDPAEVVAFAPEDRSTEFSYASEHVGHDAAIAALLACRSALLRSSERFDLPINTQEQWIDRQLGRLWKTRGAFPGMGAVLNASGIPMGHFIAQALRQKVGEGGNPWTEWQAVLKDPKERLPKELASGIDATIVKDWQRKPTERRGFLELLSRLDLTDEQAEVLVDPSSRSESGIVPSDADYVRNPYLIYESTRLTTQPVSVGTVDRGVFATQYIRKNFALPEPSVVNSAVDGRRLRALSIRELEQAALEGDTLRSQATLVSTLRRRESERDEQYTPVTTDLMRVVEEDHFAGEVRSVAMADGSRAYQLARLSLAGELIRATLEKRISGKRHQVLADWRAELDEHLPALPADAEERARELRAREEKGAALAELAAARFSVLIGPAGTGKTTLLSVLCGHSAVEKGGILMLAPTGKARVRMEDVARKAGIDQVQAYTIAQFLSGSKPPRYDGSTGRYLMTGQVGQPAGRTVIIDECSMLTEEMVAALLEALSGVHRLIMVGDPRQLPPIGAGRPFSDIIRRLAPDDIESRFPRVGHGFAELTIPRRQGAGERDDLQLTAWFGGGVLAPGEDQVFEILAGKRSSKNIQFVRWDTADELASLLPTTLAGALGFDSSQQESKEFARSLGGNLDANGSVWFNAKWGDKYSGAGAAVERWQLLTPVRQKPWGVDMLNRLIHLRYQGPQIEHARNPGKYRNIPRPMGDYQIIYGDKVINNRNRSVWKKRIYPEPPEPGYLANGEIGIVVGHRRTKARNWFPNYLEIEFSTQVGRVFKFYDSDFDDDRESKLDLAYALTVHKAQGSEFSVVLLVLPRSTQMLTRELLYTALTRQKDKIIVLHQGSAIDLQRLSSERYSATARRLTNLFGAPKPVSVGDAFLEERLIHRTSRGEAVRSKSEVIIANLLFSRNINYQYEQALQHGGLVKYPDFTIEDSDAGVTYYWEHCGLLHDPAYLRRWKDKQAWYREQEILPIEEGGGSEGVLIVTRDRPDGGFDSSQIVALADKIGGR